MSRSGVRTTGHAFRCLLAVACLVLAGCETELYSSLREQEANEILAALADGGIHGKKARLEGDNWQVLVDETQLGTALSLLRAQGLPQERRVTMGDVFQKQGLVSTPSEERMRYIFAVSQELSQTLREIDGVVSARVHVVIPENDPLSTRVRPSSAAVFIKHAPDTDLQLLTPTVKDLVAHSIEGLTHAQVALTLIEARRPEVRVAAASAALPAGAETDAFSRQTVAIVVALLIAGAISLIALPALLRKNGRDWGWFLNRVLRR
ncbi:type III secretion system inner membrane ring lipoprotein SctJ [Propionivibrio soli]|uniref:type III secretion system inner membrane ring lipoprotein SctJ n=1 Tax=Propionivibrio soli TaxID=2976531 RepID=UPI0021E8B943|nr:type III secretion inner membrane ring lipoprotein SctJ [Propionivibrio soli]